MGKPKNIFITGATSGIGWATAHLLHQQGHTIGSLGRNSQKIEALSSLGAAYACDIKNPEAVSAAVEAFVSDFGSIDVLVNNAGMGVFNPISAGSLEEWHDMIDINVKGALTALHACLPHLLQSKGMVIQLGSLGSHQVFPNSGVYCASKHALWAISESLRLELSGQLSVTTISPGPVDTGFIASTTNPDLVSTYKDYFAAGLSPQVIAEQIAYAIAQNEHHTISEIILRPNRKEF